MLYHRLAVYISAKGLPGSRDALWRARNCENGAQYITLELM